MYNAFEDYGELLEDIESDEADEMFENDEAAPRRGRGNRWGKVPTARKGNPVPQRVAQGYATKADLQATAQRLDARIATNSKAIATVDGRVRAVEGESAKIRAALKKELHERKLATDALKKGLDDQRQLALLLALLSTQDTVVMNGQNVVVDNGDQFSKLLPIMLMTGGLGGSSTGGGGLFGGDGGNLGTLAMVMALAK